MNNKHMITINSNLYSMYNFYLIMKNKFFENKEIKQYVSKNKELKDQYLGETCFILGNGPSLKKLDFKKLSDKYVFTVNSLYKNENFHELNSNFHVYSDFVFFSDDFSTETAKNIREELLQYNIMTFLPSHAEKFIAEYQFQKNCRIYSPILHFHNKSSSKIMLDKYTIDCSSVVFQCIQIALYMGFKTIYLLGCDCTGIQNIIEKKLGQSITNYAYSTNENDNKLYEKIVTERDMYTVFQTQANIFEQYKVFKKIVESNGASICNLTQPTILDSIARKKLEDVL